MFSFVHGLEISPSLCYLSDFISEVKMITLSAMLTEIGSKVRQNFLILENEVSTRLQQNIICLTIHPLILYLTLSKVSCSWNQLHIGFLKGRKNGFPVEKPLKQGGEKPNKHDPVMMLPGECVPLCHPFFLLVQAFVSDTW